MDNFSILEILKLKKLGALKFKLTCQIWQHGFFKFILKTVFNLSMHSFFFHTNKYSTSSPYHMA